jgi:hypothetical protein
MHGPYGIVFMRLRIAKVHQEPVTEVLGDMAGKTLDDHRAGGLIGPNDLPQVFGVELAGEPGGIHQVTEEHRELAAFGISGLGYGERRCTRCWWALWDLSWRRGLRRWGAGPDQPPPICIHNLGMREAEFLLEGLEVRIIECELHPERPIRDPTPLAQQREHLIHHCVKVHKRPSPCLPGSA